MKNNNNNKVLTDITGDAESPFHQCSSIVRAIRSPSPHHVFLPSSSLRRLDSFFGNISSSSHSQVEARVNAQSARINAQAAGVEAVSAGVQPGASRANP